MIVSQKQATEAAALLGLDINATLDKHAVTVAYRAKAMETHPDKGGTLEAFAAVDRAKHIMELWVSRVAEKVAGLGRPCEACDGTGYIRQNRGFNTATLRRQCTRCRGSGDADYDHDHTVD